MSTGPSPHTEPIGAHVERAASASDSDPSLPPALRCRLVHAIARRVRARVEPPGLLERYGEALEGFLRAQPGIEDVRCNAGCESVIATFDPDRLGAEGVVGLIDGLPLAGLTPREPGEVEAQDGTAWPYLCLSTAAVAADVFFGSSLAAWLLAGAAVPIFQRAIESVAQKGRLNVDTLDAAATAVLALQGRIRTAGVMVWLVSLGDVVRDLTFHQSRRAIEGLFGTNIQHAWVVRGHKKVRVRVEEIQKGDEVVVYPGELITVDGIVVKGKATVDQKVLTGESMPSAKGPGDSVYAATVVREGKIYLKAAKVGEETMVANVVRLVRRAPLRETRIQNYAERFADRLVPWSFMAAGTHLALSGSANGAAALLIIDYGSGIRVAAPTTVLAALTRAARQGILVKGGRHLERLAETDTIVFDKTGTLTLGTPEVVEVISYAGAARDAHLLALAAAAEDRLAHPMAQAILRAARAKKLPIPDREASEYSIGLGVEALIDGRTVHVGSHRFMTTQGVNLGKARSDLARVNDAAASPVFVAEDGQLIGVLVCNDPVRPEAPAVIRALRERGLRDIIMLTGDHPAVAKTAADMLGITRYIADSFPEQKSDFVKSLQQGGATVAVVGDGINDSPALALADVGIAVHGGTDVARETAHIAILEGNLWKIPQAIDIARQAIGLVEQNWKLIFYPNTAAIALSLVGWIGPVGATLLSNGAGVLASLNALRPLLAAEPRSDQRGDEVLDRELRRRSKHDGTQPRPGGPARPAGVPGRLPQMPAGP